MIIALVIVFGGIFGFDYARSYFMGKFFASFEPPPAVISATKAKSETWTPAIDAVGSLVAVNGVDVSAETSGMVVKIFFQSGDSVKKGQPLVQLDDRADQQDLKNFQAQLALAKINYDRSQKLYKQKAVSEAQRDTDKAKMQEAVASVAKTEVLISEKLIKAPFAGKIGIREINLGQYVSPGSSVVTLQLLNPLYVQFYLPQQDYKDLYVNQPIELTVDAYPDKKFKGKITAINAKVDTNTRNILIQASLPNDGNLLVPGMFANTKVLLPKQDNVITVPQTAISFSLYGDSIYVINQDGKDKKGKPILKVKREYIKVGDRRAGQVAILSGIKAGDEIVTSGQLKLQDGMRVEINNSNPM